MLSCIVSWLTPTLGEDKCMYADLPGHRASDSPPATIPTDILSTFCRPDLFLCVGSTIKILELTVCSNTVEGFSNARSRKQCKQMYIEMVGDLESRGYVYSVSYNTIEIGSLGHYTNLTLKALCNFASELLTKSECSKHLNSAKISISCSLAIFLACES